MFLCLCRVWGVGISMEVGWQRSSLGLTACRGVAAAAAACKGDAGGAGVAGGARATAQQQIKP